MTASTRATGSCLCGQVRYTVTGPLRPVIACHCQQCRKSSGHFVAATSARHEDLAIEGEVTWYRSSPDAKRGFCGICGSSLFWSKIGNSRMSIHAGTLDGDAGVTLIGHIYTDDKGAYYPLNDPLPHAPQNDPNLTTQGTT